MIRKAILKDVSKIHKLINDFAKEGTMLPRSLNVIYENLRDFWVYESNGRLCGCCALHVVGWEGLVEIKSLAVEKSKQKKGLGSILVKKILPEAKQLGAKKIFVLTYNPDFFKRFGFRVIDKKRLPQKIWVECCNCPKYPDCDEVALIKKLN